MDAGLITYKLCNYDYDCEACPFDKEMRQSGPGLRPSPRKALPSKAAVGPQAQGLEVRQGCFYHSGHTWAEPLVGSEGERVRVGLDAFAALILPRVKDAILPSQGSAIEQDHVFCWLVCGSTTLPLLAPVSGTVVAANRKLRALPRLVTSEPHGEGWLVEVEPSDLARDLERLQQGDAAASWMARERRKFERLASLLGWSTSLERGPPGRSRLGLTLANGGERVIDKADAVSINRYMELIGQFFL
jgi:glycine cleavage system H protein